MIVPNPDIYGSHAGASALADYLELLAVHRVSMTRASLGDVIADASWRLTTNESVVIPGEEIDEFDEPHDRVYSLIRQRAEILGTKYPFSEDTAGRLSYTAGEISLPYLALLAITLAHAHHVPAPIGPENVFEQTVADVLAARGWRTTNFGGLRRRSSFAAAVTACAEPLMLKTNPGAASHMVAAQDEGIDTIVHVPWCGSRPGRWIFIGQVTCAMSNAWKTKILEPSPPQWMRFLGDPVHPIGFLAIPHHAEPRHRISVMDKANRVLLDRLSLVQHKHGVSADEQAILDATLAFGVEQPS